MTASIVVFPILFITLIIPVIVGVYVHRDAKKRNMNATLWTLDAVLAPSLIGFIIYLLIRGSYSNLKCPKCNTSITEQYVICPKCGVKLKPSCPNCATPVETDWNHCPKCTEPLPEQYEDITAPYYPKDTSLGKILAVVIIIPLLLIITLIFLCTTMLQDGASSTMGEMSLEELYEVQDNPEVKNWIESLEAEPGKAYALQYAYTDKDGTKHSYYLLYVPEAASSSGVSVAYNGFFKESLLVEFSSGEPADKLVYCIQADSEKELELEVYCDNVKLECEVTEVSFNPTKFLMEPMEEELEEESLDIEE
ncbi:MAG: zinc ribbon domain-containing protein [Lachnospiraceae bacterium]|nr:zinc ribbon domain-containing protein [Lachnospiraceae bacterium]